MQPIVDDSGIDDYIDVDLHMTYLTPLYWKQKLSFCTP